MGFYTVVRNRNNVIVAEVSHEVWNPNVEYLYVPLGLDNPFGVQFSGSGELKSFSLEQVQTAFLEVENRNFIQETERETLHPIVLLLSGGYSMTFDPQQEKRRILKFLLSCIDVARDEGEVTLYLG